MTIIRPRSDVVYGICRVLPSGLIYRYNVISFFDTPLNLTISFVYIFSRGFKQRISSELIHIHVHITVGHLLFMETIINALLEIFSAHNFGTMYMHQCFLFYISLKNV